MKTKKKKSLIRSCDKCYFKSTGACLKNSPCDLGMTVAKFKTFIENLLRKGTLYWKPREEAIRLARVAPATVKCAICGDWICDGADSTFAKVISDAPDNIVVRMGEMKLDHNPPVVPIEGFTNWQDYITRMFCFTNHFHVLCKECHDKKTGYEREMRRK